MEEEGGGVPLACVNASLFTDVPFVFAPKETRLHPHMQSCKQVIKLLMSPPTGVSRK